MSAMPDWIEWAADENTNIPLHGGDIVTVQLSDSRETWGQVADFAWWESSKNYESEPLVQRYRLGRHA